MAIDSRIALGFNPPEIPSQLNMLGQALQIQGLQRQNKLGDLEMQERQAVSAEREALRNYLGGNPALDSPEGQAGLYKVAPTQAGGILKGRADLAKEQALTTKATVETAGAQLKQKHDAITFNLQALGGVNDPQTAQQWISSGVQQGLISMQQAQQSIAKVPTDPAAFQQWKQAQMQQGMTIAQQMEQAMKQREFAYRQTNDAANRGVTIRGQDVSAATARRGQDMTDTRSRESTAATLTKPFEVTGPDGLPMLVQQDKKGNLSPVAGFGPKSGSAKPLTEGQAKALLFGSRMQESNKILGEMAGRGVEMPSVTKQVLEGIPFVGGGLGAAANSSPLVSGDEQSVEQAQRDFINAVLRRESGAVISDSEFVNARKQYFPAIGDSAQVKEQKAKNRQLAINGLLAEVPEGRRNSISTPAKAPTGVKFLGFEN